MTTSGIPCQLHFQFLNNSSGICYVKLIHLKERRIIMNSNKVGSGVGQTRTDLCQPFAKALMGFHGALAVLEAVLACTNYRYHT